MAIDWDQLLEHPGVHLLPTLPPREELEGIGRDHNLAVYFIDLAHQGDKQALLGRLGEKLSFPSYFGENWDALQDCLTDLSWLSEPGYLIVLTDSATVRQRSPDDFATCLDVFRDSAEYWQDRGVPFHVLAENSDD